jgi:hypothetical protein
MSAIQISQEQRYDRWSGARGPLRDRAGLCRIDATSEASVVNADEDWNRPKSIIRGQPPEHYSGQDRSHDRPGRGDRREMLAEQKLGLDRHVIEIVAQLDCRRRPL